MHIKPGILLTYGYPVVLKNSGPISTVINPEELSELENVEELIKRIEKLTA